MPDDLTVEKIHLLFEHYENELYTHVREEQLTDDSYIEDTFVVPEVKNPHQVYRSGTGRRMVEAPAEELISRNPQVIVHTENQEVTKRLQTEITRWIDVLRRQNPNPFKETIKNTLARGEAYIQTVHNEDWVTGQKVRVGPPVLFIVPDPMVLYGSPSEDANGIPTELFVKYERQPQDVIYKYPDWTVPPVGLKADELIEWSEFWRGGVRYFEANHQAVLPINEDKTEFGIQENIYGFVPFVRRYSGFGRRAWDGKLESLIVSDIKFSRDLIREETATRSDIASILHLFAHRPFNFQIPSGTEVDIDKLASSVSLGAYDVNVFELPDGSKIVDFDVLAPTAEMFQHLRDIKGEIAQRNPFILAGLPTGASGRQQDLSSISARRRYETVAENVETLWATAFEMAIKIIKVVPTLIPSGLHKADVERDDIQVTVRLMADDPVEADRLATLGERLWNMGRGSISLRENLIEYQGKSPDEAENIIVDKLVEKVTLENPEVAAVLGMEFAREAGLMDEIEEARQLQADQAQSRASLAEAPPPTTVERTQGETQTPTGAEMIDQSLVNRGSRRPPSRFTRGS